MTALAWLIPAALALGGLGLAAFLWSLQSGQYEDLEGAGWRALDDESERTGWVMDSSQIKSVFAPVYEQLDHHYLNEIDGLSNPTSENIARWIWERLKPALPGLCRIVLHETCTSGCVYTGPEPEESY